MTVMAAPTLISALNLPDSCRVDQRVPKKLLLENGALTAADKRLMTDAIEEIQWLAALKPNTIGVPQYRDEQREYLEIAVLTVTLRGAVKPASRSRLGELVHRAVPYPVLLLLIEGPAQTLSLAHKRWAQNEAGKVVLEGHPVFASLPEAAAEGCAEIERAFMQSLSITHQSPVTMLTLYQGWMDCVQALLAARLTGSYCTATTPQQAAARRQALADYARLEAEINGLRTQAAKEKQLARQVELNLTLKQLNGRLDQARRHL